MELKKNKKKIFSTLVFISMLVGALVIFVFVYRQLSTDPSLLFGDDYQALLDDIGDPVSNPNTPTIEQVVSWLNRDSTSELPYVEDLWMCGEYSAMLLNNAKDKSWRMYVVIMIYSVEGESGYGMRNVNGNNGHAFNLIYTQDGDDLGDELDVWYIEPQADTVWQLSDGHFIVYNYYRSMFNTIWDTVFWVNYYHYVG